MVMSLLKTTVNLTERSTAALQLAMDLTGDGKTDTINRAVQIYSYLMYSISEGADIHLKDKDGNEHKVIIM